MAVNQRDQTGPAPAKQLVRVRKVFPYLLSQELQQFIPAAEAEALVDGLQIFEGEQPQILACPARPDARQCFNGGYGVRKSGYGVCGRGCDLPPRVFAEQSRALALSSAMEISSRLFTATNAFMLLAREISWVIPLKLATVC